MQIALERELVWAGASVGASVGVQGDRPNVQAGGQSRPEPEEHKWVAEITEPIRAVSLQATGNTCPGPRVCWGCGQPICAGIAPCPPELKETARGLHNGAM